MWRVLLRLVLVGESVLPFLLFVALFWLVQ